MKNQFNVLLSPIEIGTCMIKNRILQCPMDPGPIVNEDREFDYRAANILQERAKGGVGLLITGSIYVLNPDWSSFADHRDVFLEPASKMCEKIHSYGAKIFGQLTIGVGRCTLLTPENVDKVDKSKLVSPADGLPNAWMPHIKHNGVSKEWINNLLKYFSDSAKLLKDAGFDGVEVHALHEGYLLDQFAIANLNHRTDEYGGSLDNRLRLAKELLEAARSQCGEDYPVIMRMSIESKMKGLNQGALPGDEYEEYGRNRQEAREIAIKLQEMGYDAIDADNGSNEAWYWSHPPVYMDHLCNLDDVAYVKEVVDIPVYCAGKMDDPVQIAKAVEEGKISGVGVGRALLSDSEYVNKIRDGKLEDIRPCIACNSGCFRIIFQESLTCAINPRVGMEDENNYGKSPKPTKVMVIGGGIGGMEVARICAMRGHTVDLFEAGDRLGGVFNAAAAPKCKNSDKKLIEWYERQMEHENITVHLNSLVTAQMPNVGEYEHIFTASGSTERVLPIPTSEKMDVRTAIDTLNNPGNVGKKVVVVGGGLTGCEIAMELSRMGSDVEIVEMLGDVLQVKGLNTVNSMMLRAILDRQHVRIHTDTKLTQITDNGIIAVLGDKKLHIKADTVVVAAGYISNHVLYDSLIKLHDNVYNIGDSRCVGNLLTVVEDAYNVAMSI